MENTSDGLDLVVKCIAITHQMIARQADSALEGDPQLRLYLASGVLVDQHGEDRLRLNWMNIFLWGTEPEIETQGLDTGWEPPGNSDGAPLWQ